MLSFLRPFTIQMQSIDNNHITNQNRMIWVFHRLVLMTPSSVSRIWWSCPLLCLVASSVASRPSSSSTALSFGITPSSTWRPCPYLTWCTWSSHLDTSMRSCSLRAMHQWQVLQRYFSDWVKFLKKLLLLGLPDHIWCDNLQHLHCDKWVYNHSCYNRQVSGLSTKDASPVFLKQSEGDSAKHHNWPFRNRRRFD